MLIQTQLCSADTFGVSVGETFTYECITSERTLVWGSNSSLSEGYSLDDHHFAIEDYLTGLHPVEIDTAGIT